MTRLAVWWTLLPVTAPPPVTPPGTERGEEFGKTSPIALVVILLLGLATVLLIRSMTKRLRNVPPSFDPPGNDGTDDRASDRDGPDGGTSSESGGSAGVDRTEGPPGTGSP